MPPSLPVVAPVQPTSAHHAYRAMRAFIPLLPLHGARAPRHARFTCSANTSVRLVACDMDGTMLNSRGSASERNIAVVKRLLDETDVHFMPATGKSRAGALRAMGTLGSFLNDLHPAGVPGVFLQGLLVFGLGGGIVYENHCCDTLSREVVRVAQEFDLALIAYSRDEILCAETNHFTDLLPEYSEPSPEAVGDWEVAIRGPRTLNKFIYMDEPARIDALRPEIERRLGTIASLTQAQGNMLEVLPFGSSKGDGVKKLLNHVSVHPHEVLAIGDAENDLEMLKMVGSYSCAVANALPSVKAVAKAGISSNDEHGVAKAIERFVFTKADVAAGLF